MELNYELDLKIDEGALDVEWLNQADLSRRYGRHLIDLKRTLDKADERVKTVRSELVMEANHLEAKEVWNKTKPTAGDIEAYYRTNQKYKVLKQKYLDAKEEYEYAEIVVNEIRFTRKAALEQLVTLFTSSYFAGPSIPRNLKEEVTKFNISISEKLNKKGD